MLLDYYFACPLEYLRKRSGDHCAGPDGGRECARTCFAHQVEGDARWTLRERIFHALLTAVDVAVSPSRHAADYFRTLWPDVDPTIVPLGLDGVERVPGVERAPTEPLHVAYVGAVAEHKGVHVLVESAAQADAPVTLTILGQVYDAAYADRLRALAAGRASVDFRLVGAFDEGDLPSLLADVDVAAFPSQVREVFPLAPREVLARGVPVLVARLGALPEAVDDGVNGLTFDATSSGELTALLSRLAGDRSLVSRLRSGARATRVPTVAEHVDRIRDVYEHVIVRRPDDAGLDDVEQLHAQLAALRARE